MPHSIDPPDACQWLIQSRLLPVPAPLTLNWLFNEDSLTRRLTWLSNDGFSVTPLFEGWQPLRDDECAALALPPASIGWVREVYLRGHGQPWVFARSVAARSALQGDGLHMDELGSRSLGELLFCDQAFTRQPIEVCHYPQQWLPVADQVDGLWARRSRFDRGPLSVLVAEIFLPSFWHALHAHPENC
ncbi:chorismate lyase [Pseudomonas canadensis]|uniref:chorismate--pyruvate lyase family protein n=1 Tax=Pseudomonas canadensis TaxID=915099 RepID=UPI000F05CB5F|nr:chorismate lyase [Pseudomonas canadensis]MEB2644495.1 chorismate lyase [Pseudomonas canadensis]